jgi:hypothetical protein
MLELWSTVLEKNALVPPSKAAAEPRIDDEKALDAILRRLVRRLTPDLPGPLPDDLFDVAAAHGAAGVVACALGRLHPASRSGSLLVQAMRDVPAPQTAAQHVTQAAILWHAVPIARRLLSEVFRSLNEGRSGGESQEAVGEEFLGFLAARPLLSLRAETEELFCHSPAPALDGIPGCLGLRRWTLERLSIQPSNEAAALRQAAAVRKIAGTWPDPDSALRDLLFLRDRLPGPASPAFLAEFSSLFDRGRWPEDLAPTLRRQALALRKPPEEVPHDPAEPLA